jgi:hypothetical protein
LTSLASLPAKLMPRRAPWCGILASAQLIGVGEAVYRRLRL